MILSLFLLFCLILGGTIYWYWTIPRGLPPGPLGLPLIGYFVDWNGMHEKFVRLGKKYGGIWCFYRFGKLVVVINDYEIMRQAMVKQGDGFTRKLDDNVPYRVLHLKEGLLYVDGDRWHEQRRFAINTLRKLGVGRSILENTIQDEIQNVIRVIRKHANSTAPFDPESILMNLVGNISCRTIFGRRYDYEDPKFRALIEVISQAARRANLGILIGLKGWFRFFPFVNRTWEEAVQRQNRMHDMLREFIRDCESGSNDKESYIEAYRKEQRDGKDSFFTDDQLLYATRDLLGASLDTTATTLLWSILLCSVHPEVQRSCQHELDLICQNNNPMNFQDRLKTPFVEATMMEVQRFASVLAFLSRGASRDVQLGPYRIPEGAAVFANISAVHWNEKYFPNPKQFDPDRFLDADGRIDEQKSEMLMAFGLGKRACLGEGLARMSLYLVFGMLLKHFTFEIPEGSPPLSLKPMAAITLHPYPFQVTARCRDNI